MRKKYSCRLLAFLIFLLSGCSAFPAAPDLSALTAGNNPYLVSGKFVMEEEDMRGGEYEPDRDQANYHSANTVVDEFLPADFVYYEHCQDGCEHIHETDKDG